MKKIKTKIIGLVFSAVAALMLTGCPAQPEENVVENKVQFSEGWWLYTTEAVTGKHIYYIEYDADKNITRAGTDKDEYTDATLESMKKSVTYQWDKCADNAAKSDKITFKKINNVKTDTTVPEWINNVLVDGANLTVADIAGEYYCENFFTPYIDIPGYNYQDKYSYSSLIIDSDGTGEMDDGNNHKYDCRISIDENKKLHIVAMWSKYEYEYVGSFKKDSNYLYLDGKFLSLKPGLADNEKPLKLEIVK